MGDTFMRVGPHEICIEPIPEYLRSWAYPSHTMYSHGPKRVGNYTTITPSEFSKKDVCWDSHPSSSHSLSESSRDGKSEDKEVCTKPDFLFYTSCYGTIKS